MAIVIGDVAGRFDELMALIKKMPEDKTRNKVYHKVEEKQS